jgi:hypothetical protein
VHPRWHSVVNRGNFFFRPRLAIVTLNILVNEHRVCEQCAAGVAVAIAAIYYAAWDEVAALASAIMLFHRMMGGVPIPRHLAIDVTVATRSASCEFGARWDVA